MNSFQEGDDVMVYVSGGFYRRGTFVRETKHSIRYHGQAMALVQFKPNKGPSQVPLTTVKKAEVI